MNFDPNYFWGVLLHPPAALINGLGITVIATILAMVLGIALGLVGALLGLSRWYALKIINLIYITFFRGTPLLVQLMLIYFGLPCLLGVDIFPPEMTFAGLTASGALMAGILVFGLHEGAIMSEVIRSGIRSIDQGQSEAAAALAMTPGLAMRRIILPQAVRVIVPPLGNGVNAMFKTTSLLSVIAVPEMFHIADALQAVSYRTFEVYLAVSCYYLALTGIWAVIQAQIEKRVNQGF